MGVTTGSVSCVSGPLPIPDDVVSLFVPDGEDLVPTDLARGPWSPEALHGGSVAAVVVRSVERATGEADGMQLSRLTLELLRPVGTTPLRITSRVVRPGRKVQLVDTVVEQSGRDVAWGGRCASGWTRRSRPSRRRSPRTPPRPGPRAACTSRPSATAIRPCTTRGWRSGSWRVGSTGPARRPPGSGCAVPVVDGRAGEPGRAGRGGGRLRQRHRCRAAVRVPRIHQSRI